jgi:DNA-binding CsgD family transcriptional regulator
VFRTNARRCNTDVAWPAGPVGGICLRTSRFDHASVNKEADMPPRIALLFARRSLQKAVRNLEQVRASLQEASSTAAVGGRLSAPGWTTVARFREGGARYIVIRQSHASGVAVLTDAERAVVENMARGLSTKEAACALGVDAATVRVLLMRAARRLGVRDRRGLINLWRIQSPEQEMDHHLPDGSTGAGATSSEDSAVTMSRRSDGTQRMPSGRSPD